MLSGSTVVAVEDENKPAVASDCRACDDALATCHHVLCGCHNGQPIISTPNAEESDLSSNLSAQATP